MVRGVLSAVLLSMVLGGCDKRSTPAMISQEDKELLDRVKAKEKERDELRRAPARYILPGEWSSFDKGIINTYTKATTIVFTNTSQFDVSDIRGKITYFNGQDEEMATVPFKASGELQAGKTLRLNVNAGEISGGAAKARTVVDAVHVRE
jgi:hypothetical protein